MLSNVVTTLIMVDKFKEAACNYSSQRMTKVKRINGKPTETFKD